MSLYEYVPRQQIIEALRHIRNLLRQSAPLSEQERLVAERREIVAKYIISNLPRTGPHPTLNTVMEIVDTFLLTVGAAHELFGYDLDALREYDLRLNSGRTHIVESYTFARDKLVSLPMQLAGETAFQSDALLKDLVREWQTSVPLQAINRNAYQPTPNFYVHVGTEDSRGSSLPPGSLALVEPVDSIEAQRPNPRLIYLLQFGNGYRCSRCVVSHGKLQMLASSRTYSRAREFAYPAEVRLAGRIRLFAHALPQPEYELQERFRTRRPAADLVLPWEQPSRDRLFLTEHHRFLRSEKEEVEAREFLSHLLRSPLTKRTERRYRHPGTSDPHVSTLIQLTLLHFARYSDSLRNGGPPINDRGRYTLEAMFDARGVEELTTRFQALPIDPDLGRSPLRAEFVDRLPLLSFKFPKLSLREDPVLRLSRGFVLSGIHPALAAGSWVLLEPLEKTWDLALAPEKTGWSRRLYVLRRGLRFLTGYLEKDSNGIALISAIEGAPRKERLNQEDLSSLHGVAGVAVPV